MFKNRKFDPNRLIYPRVPLVFIFLGIPLITYFIGVSLKGILISALCFFLFDGLGVQIGVHKHLCHRSFQTHKFIRRFLAFLSILSSQGSPMVWVAVHTGSHHPHADTDMDIHAPNKGLWFAFLAWYWRADLRLINFQVCREYLKDKVLVFLHRHHTVILFSYWICLAVFGGPFWLAYAGLLPAGVSVILAGVVNAFLHSKGRVSEMTFQKYQNYSTDVGYNSFWVGLLTMGLGLHNNHHHDPARCYYDVKWYEFDPSRLVIPFIRKR